MFVLLFFMFFELLYYFLHFLSILFLKILGLPHLLLDDRASLIFPLFEFPFIIFLGWEKIFNNPFIHFLSLALLFFIPAVQCFYLVNDFGNGEAIDFFETGDSWTKSQCFLRHSKMLYLILIKYERNFTIDNHPFSVHHPVVAGWFFPG